MYIKRPSEIIKNSEKSRSKALLFRELFRFEFSIVFYCSSIVSYPLWIINEGIVYFKNEYNFWIPRAKNDRNVKFYRSNSIISKIMRPSVLQFSVLKGTPVQKLYQSDVTLAQNAQNSQNSNLNNSRNNKAFDLLFSLFFMISEGLLIYIKKSYAKIYMSVPL